MKEFSFWDYLDELYKAALMVGIEPSFFYESDLNEIKDMVKSRTDKYYRDLKDQALIGYQSSVALAGMIAAGFSKDPSAAPRINQLYPGLFDDELKESVPEWKRQKANMEIIAAKRNAYLEEQKRKEANK